jgi:hypothetical protein
MIPQIKVLPYVLSDKTGKVHFLYDGSRSKIVEGGNGPKELVDSVTIDQFVSREDIKRLDFITLDVEGAEKKVLEGAKETISKFRPKLAISVYHSTADFFEIPSLVSELCPDYKLDIGIYSSQGVDIMLHAHIE